MSSYGDRTYRKRAAALKAKAKRNAIPCHLCLKPINWDADWKAADSFTADHIEALAQGGRLLGELRPAHRGCNARRGKRDLTEYLNQSEQRKPTKPKTTRKWYG